MGGTEVGHGRCAEQGHGLGDLDSEPRGGGHQPRLATDGEGVQERTTRGRPPERPAPAPSRHRPHRARRCRDRSPLDRRPHPRSARAHRCDAIARSSWRPPWFDTQTPAAPWSTASRASAGVRIPLMISGRSDQVRISIDVVPGERGIDEAGQELAHRLAGSPPDRRSCRTPRAARRRCGCHVAGARRPARPRSRRCAE